MKRWLKIAAMILMLSLMTVPLSPAGLAANDRISTSPTGFTRAGDVEYVSYSGTIQVTSSTSYTVENVVVNWGARGEECVFLSTYAQDYYTGSYSWDTLSGFDGGTETSDAYQSQLYSALQDMMQAMHGNIQGYQLTRAYYSFTDCVRNDYSQVSSFYSGSMADGKWLSGKYNREHIWPKSKCVNTNKADDSADIMLLRPSLYSENSTRGNLAYGEGSGYYDPGASVRGDCARMVLYGYVRWGNTGKMWGTGGVMESLDILLKWMEEDPVDTWEMGRNDAVQSITGVRNVFVDYPEFAWLLFGQEVPEDIATPSGSTEEKPCVHENTELRNAQDAACSADGYTGDTFCADCGEQVSAGSVISPTGEHSFGDWSTVPGGGKEGRWCSICGYEETRDLPDCSHANTELTGETAPTCTEDGYTGNTWCTDCGKQIAAGTIIPATGHQNTLQETGRLATCTEDGCTGDKRCIDCGAVVEPGTILPATGEHNYSESDTCKVCGYQQPKEAPEPEPTWPIIAIAAVVILIGGIAIVVIIKKKKQ